MPVPTRQGEPTTHFVPVLAADGIIASATKTYSVIRGFKLSAAAAVHLRDADGNDTALSWEAGYHVLMVDRIFSGGGTALSGAVLVCFL